MAATITYTHKGGQEAFSPHASGLVTGDSSAAASVYCGFQPSRILLCYKDASATTNDKIILWFSGMTAGYYFRIAQDGTVSLQTSGGPTVLADATGEGVTIPAALIDADADSIYFSFDR